MKKRELCRFFRNPKWRQPRLDNKSRQTTITLVELLIRSPMNIYAGTLLHYITQHYDCILSHWLSQQVQKNLSQKTRSQLWMNIHNCKVRTNYKWVKCNFITPTLLQFNVVSRIPRWRAIIPPVFTSTATIALNNSSLETSAAYHILTKSIDSTDFHS